MGYGYTNTSLTNMLLKIRGEYVPDASLSTDFTWNSGSLEVSTGFSGATIAYVDASLLVRDAEIAQIDASVIRVDAADLVRDAEINQLDASIIRIDALAISLVDVSLYYTAADTSVWSWTATQDES